MERHLAMDQHDRNNLHFILGTQGKELEEWHAGLSDDEKLYAFDLLQTYKEELDHKSILVSDTRIIDCSVANSILNQFRL